jgi:hypothetical protein
MNKGLQSVYGEQIQKILILIQTQDFASGEGTLTANNELEFGMMVFTEDNLGQSVIDAKNRAVDASSSAVIAKKAETSGIELASSNALSICWILDLAA